ncbi:MAG: hypothetical protein ACRC2S_04670 [Waterburya sp.]
MNLDSLPEIKFRGFRDTGAKCGETHRLTSALPLDKALSSWITPSKQPGVVF